jgi:hypothetical protein
MFGLDVYSYNSQTIQEVVVETGGTSAEAMTGGVQLNIIPKDGGNTWSGSFSTSWTGPSLQSDNLDDDLRARGLQTGASVKRFRDNGGAFGGPIARDRLWFYTAQAALCAGPRSGGLYQLVLPRQQRSFDVAGDGAQQGRLLLLA